MHKGGLEGGGLDFECEQRVHSSVDDNKHAQTLIS